jgi:ribosomal protein S18 acetylase RimI-like enzyme
LLNTLLPIGRGRPKRVETQQINVPACRFYQRHGFVLETVRPDVYPGLPEEVQLRWAKPLVQNRDHPANDR